MHKIDKMGDRSPPGASRPLTASRVSLPAKLVSPYYKRPTTGINRTSSPVSLFGQKGTDVVHTSNSVSHGASSSSRSVTRSESAKSKLPTLSIKFPVTVPSINKNQSPSYSLSPNQSPKIVSPKDIKMLSMRPRTASTACSTNLESPNSRPSRTLRSSRTSRSSSPSSLNW